MKYESGVRCGHLTLTKRLTPRYWEVICDCGTTTKKELGNLSRSTICSHACPFNPLIKHGGAKGRISKEYSTWKNIKTRCFNPNYSQRADYGGRGITMYPAWVNDYAAFLAYIGPAPEDAYTVERINNDGNYEPGNVVWATRSGNCNNKSNNVLMSYKGETKTATQWANEKGIRPHIVLERLRDGWSTEAALETPVKGKRI